MAYLLERGGFSGAAFRLFDVLAMIAYGDSGTEVSRSRALVSSCIEFSFSSSLKTIVNFKNVLSNSSPIQLMVK